MYKKSRHIKSVIDKGEYYLMNDKYEIYKDDHSVYDTKLAQDIPLYVFEWIEEMLESGEDM